MELYEPVTLGPVQVSTLAFTLPGLAFPVDLSGGVRAFRHRRGDLEYVEIRASLHELGEWLRGAARNPLGPLLRPVTVWTSPGGLGMGLVTEQGALAFELLWVPEGQDARFVVANPRGIGLGDLPLSVAVRFLSAAFGEYASWAGRVMSVQRVASRISRTVLPAVGSRAAAADRVRFGDLEREGDFLRARLDSVFVGPTLGEEAGRALELALLVREADEALVRGEPELSRAAYLNALENAPRHPEIVRTVAEIDTRVGERAEAALGMIVESMPASRMGMVGAELLARVGDREGARTALAEAAREESFAPLASLILVRQAELEAELRSRLLVLDMAVARSPALAAPRWARLDARLLCSDVDGALSDAEHLEASSSGAPAKHRVIRGAAERFLKAGLVRESGRLFERALRYVPDDALATAGLARSLIAVGRGARAFSLLQRAVELGTRGGHPDPDALVELAGLLAREFRDLPQAISRIREVPSASPRAVEARGLEAGWCAALGDLAGASLAYARLREQVSLQVEFEPGWARWLRQAGKFEREVQQDLVAAEQHLRWALRVNPRDRAIEREYREVAAAVAARVRQARAVRQDEASKRSPSGPDSAPAEARDTDFRGSPSAGGSAGRPAPVPPLARDDGGEPDQESDELLAADLEARVRANPGDLSLVLELVTILERLGRDRELFALLSAQLEDAEDEARPVLAERTRATVERLIDSARTAGHDEEAAIFRSFLARL